MPERVPRAALAPWLRRFFEDYLRRQRGLSRNTVLAYRDAWRLLLQYGTEERHMPPPDQWQVGDVNRTLVLAFLEHLEVKRRVSIRTRNHRLAAVHAFVRYFLGVHPEYSLHCRRVLSIPTKKAPRTVVGFLDPDELKATFAAVPPDTPQGPRNLAMLAFAYNTGARVHEIAHARLDRLTRGRNPSVCLHGKGNKEREVPLFESTLQLLTVYLRERPRPVGADEASFLFLSNRGKRLTRFQVARILVRYIREASVHCESMRKKRLTAHSMRHTTAVHLLQSGVEENVIKAWLGHASVEATSVYLDLDMRKKREVLEKLRAHGLGEFLPQPPGTLPEQSLGDFLDQLGTDD